jgi:hypothetical protein
MTKLEEEIPLTIRVHQVKRFVIAAVLFVWLTSGFFSVINYLVRTFSTSADLKEFMQHVFIIFYVGAEFNFPTWFSSFSLMASATVIAMIAYIQHVQHKPYVRHWLGLGGLFTLFSLDEYLRFHETAGGLMTTLLGLNKAFSFSWLILGAIGITLVGIIYWPFVGALPPRTRQLFILSAIVIVGGAMGVELVQRYYQLVYGQANWGYEFIAYLEEALELSGMGLFFYTFVSQLEIVLVNSKATIVIKRQNDSPY